MSADPPETRQNDFVERLNDDELVRRRIAWDIISRMFLDTEFDRAQYQDWGRELAATGYSEKELYEIYADELAPILGWNMWVWGGFDQEWLEKEIKGGNLIGRKESKIWRPIRRALNTLMATHHWRKLIGQVRRTRLHANQENLQFPDD